MSPARFAAEAERVTVRPGCGAAWLRLEGWVAEGVRGVQGFVELTPGQMTWLIRELERARGIALVCQTRVASEPLPA